MVPAASFRAARRKRRLYMIGFAARCMTRGSKFARLPSAKGLIEEAPEAYKAVDQVVDVMAETGIAVKVARLRPIAIVKG